MYPEGTPQSITRIRIATLEFPSLEPSLRHFLHQEVLPFILRLEDGPCHLSDIVIAFFNYSKSIEDPCGPNMLILRSLKNLAKGLEGISAASSSTHYGTKQVLICY